MKVGDNISKKRGSWSFSDGVAETFVDHVRKSVPFYDEGHDLICKLSDFFSLAESINYEIGVSTGELIKKLALHNEHKKDVKWVGIDVEKEMIEKAKSHCAGIKNVEFACEDALLYDFQPANLIVSYYAIQFVPEKQRQQLINRIYESLNWGGAFIWFEKVRANDARFQDIMTSIYTDFKLDNGFTPDEIVGKAQSLKGVLSPFSTEGNLALLKRAGFIDAISVMKYVCFEGFLAIK